MKRYLSGAHTRHRLQYHIVWTPKYRRPVLLGEIAVRLRRLIVETAIVNRWVIGELNVQPDHVHLLVQIGPETSVARVVQILKGGSSFFLRKMFPALAEKYGPSLWGTGYFAESVGAVSEEVIRRYIKEQPEPDQSKLEPGSR